MKEHTKITLGNAEQYKWGNAGKGWLLANSEQGNVAERRLAPGVKEIKHYHRRSWQFFYVLSGEGTMVVNGEEILLRSNESIEIDPGQHHQFINSGEEDDLLFLVFSAPSSYQDRVEVE